MTDLNNVFVVGRLTRNVEGDEKAFSYLPNGTAKVSFCIAVNISHKSSDGQYFGVVSFFDVVLFGKPAENLKKYLVKGQQIAVGGTLCQDRWEKNGVKNSKVYIRANEIQLLGKKSNGTAAASPVAGGNSAPAPSDGFPEDIPF